MNKYLETPVVLILFNRPDLTLQVFTEIAKVKPSKLLLIADGPRPSHPSDQENCAACRAIVDKVDWECKVIKNYSDVNLGCKRRVSSGLDWVFNIVNQAIILEDDCLPHPSFFRFCEELLEYYANDERVMSIAGTNFIATANLTTGYSYYFSIYSQIWGWATWSRAWKYYDVEMKLWPKIKMNNLIENIFIDHRRTRYWQKVMDITYNNKIDTWDYQWLFSSWIQNGLTVVPSQNLVSNIGFRIDGTHTKAIKNYILDQENQHLANMPIAEMTFPLKHPPYLLPNYQADIMIQDKRFPIPNLITRFIGFIQRKLHNKY